MYRIIYNDKEGETLVFLQENLPKNIDLIVVPDKIKNTAIILEHSANAIVLPFCEPYPSPEDFAYFQFLRGISNIPAIIVIARLLTVAQAVCLMRNGAFDCLHGRPTGAVLGYVLDRLMSIPDSPKTPLLIGESRAICILREKMYQYADKVFPILISGETGSGKEVVARTIHETGPRRNGPFVPVNCALIPDELLVSELFGSCQGAFTGAKNRIGLFESANGGTLFLDEIGDMSLGNQAKLLRAVEENTIRRMGSNNFRKIDVRIIAASNKAFRLLVDTNKFRADLYYRLNILNLSVPPLRKRKKDIPLLAHMHLCNYPEISQHIETPALKVLMNYDWPGNVRELQSVVIRAAIDAQGKPVSIKNLSFE